MLCKLDWSVRLSDERMVHACFNKRPTEAHPSVSGLPFWLAALSP